MKATIWASEMFFFLQKNCCRKKLIALRNRFMNKCFVHRKYYYLLFIDFLVCDHWFTSTENLHQILCIIAQSSCDIQDLEKDVNSPQVENSELYNVFQIQTDRQTMTSYKSIKYWYGMMLSSNLDCPSSINNPLPSSWILHPLFSFILPQIPVIQHQFSIFSSSFSILSQKCRIFVSK